MRAEAVALLVGGGALSAHMMSRPRTRGASSRDVPESPPLPHPDVISTTTAPSSPLPLPGRWVWPVPTWEGRRPEVSDGFGSPRPGGRHHEGVDLMFPRRAADPFRAGSPNGDTHYVMPDGIAALAAADGVIWSAGWTARGYSVVIDHSPHAPFATYYTHLAELSVAPTQRARSGQHVRAGEPIGVIGADPLDAEHLKHLHFELWRSGPNAAIDPEPLMAHWSFVDAPSAIARNAAPLTYRPVGDRGDDYPDWVRNLRGKSGVYVIRERDADGDPTVVYVGESHTGRLYQTLTRHFQDWRRWKGFWRGQYGEGHDPGLTYSRGSVEVAVRITSPDRALDEEARLIARLRPRDNLLGQPQLEDAPF